MILLIIPNFDKPNYIINNTQLPNFIFSILLNIEFLDFISSN